jgi:hypothetical protein
MSVCLFVSVKQPPPTTTLPSPPVSAAYIPILHIFLQTGVTNYVLALSMCACQMTLPFTDLTLVFYDRTTTVVWLFALENESWSSC